MDAANLSPLLETGATGTIILLIVWLVRRVFTHTIPRLATDFKEALANQQALFLKQLDEQRIDFKEALSDQRTDFREALKDERDQLGRKLDRLAEAVETLIGQNHNSRDDNEIGDQEEESMVR